MRRLFAAGASLVLIFVALNSIEAQQSNDVISKEAEREDSLKQDISAQPSDKIIATYFHGNRRCATCRKLEAYSREALETGFAEELRDSTLIWRTVNYDRADNKHYLKDYSLYTKALILSRNRNGEEIEWRNLDKIWELVRNKGNFINYVQGETHKFIDSSSPDE